jgi:hypothetical protein
MTTLLPDRVIDAPHLEPSDALASHEPAPPPELERRTWRSRLRPLVRPSGYFLASRVGVLFAALAAKWLVPRIHPLTLLGNGWDGRWYTMIAQHGYPHRIYNEANGSRWGFFPGFPMAIRGTEAVTGLTYAHAAVLIGTIFGLGSAIAIWLAVREVFGPVIADRTVLLYVFFPAAYVLSMGYSEGLFLTAAAGCLFALSRRYWITAALCACVASITKDVGVVLIVCVAVAAIPRIVKDRQGRPLAALLIAPLGFVGWLIFSWQWTGTPLAFMKAEKIWGNTHFNWFLAPIGALARLITDPRDVAQGQDVVAAIGFLFAYVGLAILWRTRKEGISIPIYWWIFTLGSIGAMAAPDFEQSLLRYSMAAFPLFAAFAWKIRPTWEGAIAATSGLMQGALALVIFVEVLHPLTSHLWP